jgi:universal stress protein E
MSYPIHNVVAGVRTLAADDAILLAALALGERTGAAVHLVHAFEFPRLFTLEPGAQVLYPTAAQEMAADLTRQLEAVLRDLPGGSRARMHVEAGSPGETIRRVAARTRAELVVVGAAGGGRLERAILGTTAQRVLRGVSVPVLVLRRPLEDGKRLLVTTDLTELSAMVHERALDVLESIGGAADLDVRSLLVLAFDLAPPPLSAVTLQQTATEELESFLAERRPRASPARPLVRTGPAAQAIVAEAAEWSADLLVVGTHARHGLQRLMLGSVAEACLRDAPCNVLAIPPYLARRSGQVEPAEQVAGEAPAVEVQPA